MPWVASLSLYVGTKVCVSFYKSGCLFIASGSLFILVILACKAAMFLNSCVCSTLIVLEFDRLHLCPIAFLLHKSTYLHCLSVLLSLFFLSICL